MHELGLAKDVLYKILNMAQEAGLSKVSSCKIYVGATKIHHPEEFKELLEANAKGTPAQGLSYELIITPLKAKCKSCGEEFTTPPCPECGNFECTIISGAEVEIKDIC
jgi:hydrogenase nickel incorporation protein HypA/HybF